MLTTIVISAAITPIEANFIAINNQLEDFKETPTGMKTTELKKSGIIDLNVWFNMEKLKTEPFTEPNCMLNATIDVSKLNMTSFTDIARIISESINYSGSSLYGFNRKDGLEWKLKSATFTYTFTGTMIDIYYKFLRGGYDLRKSRLKKTVHEPQKKKNTGKTVCSMTEYSGIQLKKSAKETNEEKSGKKKPNRYHESIHIKIKLFENESADANNAKIEYMTEKAQYANWHGNKLEIKIFARRNKIGRICNEYGIKNRKVDDFLAKADEIDKRLFIHYITQITGSERFFKYIEAEREIMKASGYTQKEKKKMCDVLKAVASFKGISNYLNHVEDEKPAYPSCMQSVRNRVQARKVLNNIQKCKINPLTIPVRSSETSLENLITIYNECKENPFDNKAKNTTEVPNKNSKSTSPSSKGFMDFDISNDMDLPFD